MSTFILGSLLDRESMYGWWLQFIPQNWWWKILWFLSFWIWWCTSLTALFDFTVVKKPQDLTLLHLVPTSTRMFTLMLWSAAEIRPIVLVSDCPLYTSGLTLKTLDSSKSFWIMFGPGQLVSTLLPAVFHSSAAHFFPAFPTRLGSPPQILIPGPLISYESLRSYLQPEPCKEALFLATQAAGMGQFTASMGEFQPTVCLRMSELL